jgi:phosphatidylglycerol:prolipoprotein diacylglycerol transferase
MTIDFNPQAFGVPLLPWTTLLTIVGAFGAIVWMLRRASTFGLAPRTTYGIALRAALWSTLGGRLFHVIDHADFYSDVPFQVFYLWNGGLSLWGSLIVGAGGALWHAKRAGATLSAFADALTLAGLAALIVGRLGDFLAGERIGTSSSLAWAVTYANEHSAAFAASSAHPVALYEALLGIVLLVVLVRLWHRIKRGSAITIAFAGYAVGRFLIGFVTVERTVVGLDFSQWVALAILGVISLLAVRGYARSRILDSPD